MNDSRSKKMLFYVARNLFLYLILIGFYYTSVAANAKKESAHFSPVYYYIITVFYISAMVHNSILFEKLLLKKKYFLYIASLVAWFFIVVFADRWIVVRMENMPINIRSIVVGNLIYGCLAIIFYLAFKYVIERKNLYQLSLMQRDVELKQLKEHLNPHFLFNALNNIYSYTLQHNRYGNELILKLAELMRFILDNADKNMIRLEYELSFIGNYILFEKERLGERCEINFTLAGKVGEREIVPLILFPFIENACKYGADTIQKTVIDISIENNNDVLKLRVKNNIINKTPPSTKTGLQNAIRRLELLYPDKHEVLITTDQSKFSVELILKHT